MRTKHWGLQSILWLLPLCPVHSTLTDSKSHINSICMTNVNTQITKTKQRYKKGGLFLILSSHLQLNDLFLEKAESPNILSQSTGQTVRSVTYT